MGIEAAYYDPMMITAPGMCGDSACEGYKPYLPKDVFDADFTVRECERLIAEDKEWAAYNALVSRTSSVRGACEKPGASPASSVQMFAQNVFGMTLRVLDGSVSVSYKAGECVIDKFDFTLFDARVVPDSEWGFGTCNTYSWNLPCKRYLSDEGWTEIVRNGMGQDEAFQRALVEHLVFKGYLRSGIATRGPVSFTNLNFLCSVYVPLLPTGENCQLEGDVFGKALRWFGDEDDDASSVDM